MLHNYSTDSLDNLVTANVGTSCVLLWYVCYFTLFLHFAVLPIGVKDTNLLQFRARLANVIDIFVRERNAS